MISYDDFLSLYDLLHSVGQSLGPSVLLQMALFHPFLWPSNIPLYNMHSIFFIHSSVDQHLGCFHVFGIVNSAAMNIRVHVSFNLWFSLCVCVCVYIYIRIYGLLRWLGGKESACQCRKHRRHEFDPLDLEDSLE